MASFLDKIKVNTAIDNRNKLDLGCDHITTANFMQYNVAWFKELVPNEKISVSMETFTRLNPMPVPTFGRAKINNRAFFVPFRTIFPAWNDFITDVRHTYANNVMKTVDTVILLQNSVLRDYIISLSSPITGNVAYDIDALEKGASKKYKLSAKGR